ncbi:MAG: peptidoglycan DD-metalloendopeptidase family protein [Candidatus Paceibacterota bacterium]
MQKHILLVAFIILLGTGYTPTAEAQWRDWDEEDMREWRERYEESREGGDIDEDDVRSWRRQNSKTQEAIEDLDDDRVESIRIPILFGVTLDDLYPNFGDPRDGGAREHEGLDMLAPLGTPIVSPTEAVVIRIGDGSGSGEYVSTANPGGETFVYMHLDEVADIDVGDVLKAGDLIGFVGNTGNASGGPAHLHFELREDREPTDPIERLTDEFSLQEKMDALETILDEYDDAEDLAEFLVEEFLGVFIQAQGQSIDLPDEIIDALPASVQGMSGGLPQRDLTLGSQGTDVMALQSLLIAEGHLDIATPTDYFGPLTEAALAAYQRANGISPASGYYGPVTRAAIGVGSSAVPANTRTELLAELERLTKLVAELQAQLAAMQN